MNTILGIKFREYGQIYYFLAGQCAPAIGNRVIVETEQGQGIGEVVLIRDTLPPSVVPQGNGKGTDLDAEDVPVRDTDGALSEGSAPALLITNAITSAVVMPHSDVTVADIPYASAVVAKVQALKQGTPTPVDAVVHAEQDAFNTGAFDTDFAKYATENIDQDAYSTTDEHQCCGHTSYDSYTDGIETEQENAEQENLDGVLVASSELDDIMVGEAENSADHEATNTNCGESINIDGTTNYSGRMVSYDGSAGEHSSDNQVPEDTSQPLSFDDLRPILRIATEYDLDHALSNELLSREASTYCKECIKNRELDMKLVDVEVFFDLSKFIFYFTAPSRIDFRELVKDLVKHYRTRIELRQIGVRHETQMIGAVGNCGMVCCCRRFLRKFAPVTIKMAKEQNLFLNPAKISGICGRLLCCLSYEQENYEEFHRRCPRLGKKYMTSKGPIKVMRANMFRNSLIAYSESGEELEIPLEEWQEMEVRRSDAMQQSPKASRRDAKDGREKGNGAPDKGTTENGATDKGPDSGKETTPSEKNVEKSDVSPEKKPVLGCTGACERCGECGPSGTRGKKTAGALLGADLVDDNVHTTQTPVTPSLQATTEATAPTTHAQASVSATATKQLEVPSTARPKTASAPKPIQATVHDAEQVMASLSGVHQPPSPVSEHGIPTTEARKAALVQSLAGMDGGPLCSLAHPEKPLTPATIAAHVIGDVSAAAEVAAKQAPASIAMTERLIKSTDTSALKTSRGRRKRRRKPRDGGNAESLKQSNTDFYDNDME